MKQQLGLTMRAIKGLLVKRILGRHGYALLAKANNGLFAVDPEDFEVGRHLLKHGSFGADEIDRVKGYISSESKVLIVGAHIGSLAIPISKLCQKVIAIEANPLTYDLLTINIALNRSVNCEAINIAANDTSDNIDFLLSRANSGGSKRVPKVWNYMYYYDNPEQISVSAARLDDCLEDQVFDLIVMDLEGSEYFALKGMQKILSHCKVLIVEFLPHHLKNVSGITVEDFLSVITPHFSSLTIPSKQIRVDTSQFAATLRGMYQLEEADVGIIFEKVS